MKTKTQLSNRILSLVLALVMVLGMMPMSSFTAFAAEARTPVTGYNSYNYIAAQGTEIHIEAGTNGGTAVYYMNGTAKTYINENGASGDDLSTWRIYGGSGTGETAFAWSPSIIMTGGNVAEIFAGNAFGSHTVNAKVVITGGTVGYISLDGNNSQYSGGTSSGIILIDIPTVDSSYCFTGVYQSNGTWYVCGDAEIPSGYDVVIESGETMTVDSGETLTNNGTIVNNGTITVNGTLNNYGTITNNGTIYLNAPMGDGEDKITGNEVIRNALCIETTTSGTPSVYVNGSEISDFATEYSDDKLYIYPKHTGNVKVTLNDKDYYGIIESTTGISELSSEYISVTDIDFSLTEMFFGQVVDLADYVSITPTNTTYETTVTYEVLNNTTAQYSLSGSKLTPRSPGTIALKLTAQDPFSRCEETFTITIAATDVIDVEAGSVTVSKSATNGKLTVTWGGFDGGSKEYDVTDPIVITSGSGMSQGTIIVQDGVTANIVLNGVDITTSSTSPFHIQGTAAVNLTLLGDNVLDGSSANYTNKVAGIRVESGASLTIDGTGTLTARGGESGAGIGGVYNGSCGTITISGGTVTANGGSNAAGIGGGYGSGGTITISGGTVTANGGSEAAGIGGGYKGSGGTITISGGTVTANGATYGAGIGGGYEGSGGTITINGGTVTATGAIRGAGIGGGRSGAGGTVVITGGTVKVTGGQYGSAIGAGQNGSDAGTLTNGTDPVSLVTVTLNGAAANTEVSAVTGMTYGVNGVKTQDTDKLYFYLPSGTEAATITAGGREYICKDDTNTYYSTHDWSNDDGVCARCDESCEHSNITGAICDTCGKVFHTHEWEYSVSGTTITATCNADGCPNDDGGYVTISAPSDLTYAGSKSEAVVDNKITTGATVSVTYTGNTTDGYPVNAGNYTASITLDNATIKVEYTIEKATPKAEDFVFSAPTDLVYDDADKAATVEVKDGINGMGKLNVMYFRYASGMWIDNQRAPHFPGIYKVGIWLEEGDNYNAVYSNERIWLGDEFEIKYLTTEASAIISGTQGSNGWYIGDVTLTAPDGYRISNTMYSDGFTPVLTFSAEQNETITYYLKDANGDVAEKTTELKIDKTAPSAKYQIGTDGWKQFINTITFGLFCKDYKTVDIEYTDELSGVAEKQYYISSEEITDTSSIVWLDYTDTLNLNATGKYFIYMRVVDNAGHEVILNTEGIVIYEDSVQVTESVSATYRAGTDESVSVELKGNTVCKIVNGGTTLTAGTDYTVSADGVITLKADYLDMLNAGEYTFTVFYNPLGETYVEAPSNVAPKATTFKVVIEKADGKVSNINISGKTYDGTAVTAPTFDKLGDGAATIEYKVKGTDDSTYTTTAPKNAGEYIVRVTVAEGMNHKAASATAEFTISRATLKDVSVQQNGKLTYDDGKALTPAVTANATALNGAEVLFMYSADGTSYGSMPTFTDAGTYTVQYCAYTTDNNFIDQYGTFTVTIDKATVTEPTIASKPFNNSAQKADISDTDLYTVVQNNGGTAKGSYDVVLKLKDSANYKWSTTDSEEVTLQFAISAAQNSWETTPAISGWTYGETPNAPTYKAKFGAVKVVYSGKANDGTDYNSDTAPTKAGSYTATFTVDGTEDYSGLSEQVNFTVAKKAVTVTANDASKTYGDSDPALTYSHTELVGSDALVITIARASGENANTYTITASQAEGANPNYELTFKTGTFTIRKAALTVTVEDKTATYGDAVPTYTVKYDGFVNGDDKNDLGGTLVFACDYAQFSDKGEYTIKASGYTSGNYTISYVDGKLNVSAKPITVTIQNATSIYGEALAELKATDNGIVNNDKDVYSLATVATSTSNVGKYAITGTALNSNYAITFVNGEYEITKREITITIDAKNIVVNTTLPTYTYKVEGLVGADTLMTKPTLTCNANIAVIGEYDITASGADAGGNYSIKYVPAKLTVLTDNAVDAAAGYTEELRDYDPATVTSEDKAALDEILGEINTILDDENITDNGKKALEEVKEQVEKLIEEITDAADATDTENVGKVENVTPENVTPENKTDLEGAKADLEKALEDHGSNMTEDEKKAVEDEIKRIDDALEVIGNVEEVEELIDKLPDTIKKDVEAAIKAADDAYNALTDYEKSLVDEDAKKALDDAKAALAELNKPADPDSPLTGDNSNMFLWIALLFISGGAVITLTVVDRKRRTTINK